MTEDRIGGFLGLWIGATIILGLIAALVSLVVPDIWLFALLAPMFLFLLLGVASMFVWFGQEFAKFMGESWRMFKGEREPR
jgi:hypothetical protein